MRRFAQNPDYVEHELLLLELHDLIASGRGESEQAEAVRDKLDRTYNRLSPHEIERLNGLSHDLYMLSGDELPLPPNRRIVRNHAEFTAKTTDAWQRGDWEQILVLLRQGMPSISTDKLAYTRARAYNQLGHPHAARCFIDYAVKL